MSRNFFGALSPAGSGPAVPLGTLGVRRGRDSGPLFFQETKSVAILSHASLLSLVLIADQRATSSLREQQGQPSARFALRAPLFPARRVAPRRVISSRRNSISDSIIRDAAPPAAAALGSYIFTLIIRT